jgi:hypothetical protein
MLIKKGLILDKIATPVKMQILAPYKENRIQFSQYQTATQKKYVKNPV